MDMVFVDSSFFVAYHNVEDENHALALNWVQEAEAESGMLVTSDYVFDEVLTVLLVRGGKGIALRAGEALLADPTISIVRVDQSVFDEAWAVFRQFADKEWSFTDCTSYVLMRRAAIRTGASFDHHFAEFGHHVVP